MSEFSRWTRYFTYAHFYLLVYMNRDYDSMMESDFDQNRIMWLIDDLQNICIAQVQTIRIISFERIVASNTHIGYICHNLILRTWKHLKHTKLCFQYVGRTGVCDSTELCRCNKSFVRRGRWKNVENLFGICHTFSVLNSSMYAKHLQHKRIFYSNLLRNFSLTHSPHLSIYPVFF